MPIKEIKQWRISWKLFMENKSTGQVTVPGEAPRVAPDRDLNQLLVAARARQPDPTLVVTEAQRPASEVVDAVPHEHSGGAHIRATRQPRGGLVHRSQRSRGGAVRRTGVGRTPAGGGHVQLSGTRGAARRRLHRAMRGVCGKTVQTSGGADDCATFEARLVGR